MEKLLIFIKHNLAFLWRIIEWGNGIVFSWMYRSRLEKVLEGVFEEIPDSHFAFRKLVQSDLVLLHELLKSQNDGDLDYFKPHGFDVYSLKRQLEISSFLMMGVFEREKMAGYFFLRFFANKKCFVGRLTDKDYRGKGIGQVMNRIMYETAWRMGFRCLSTISRNNTLVMKAHAGNSIMVVLKELAGDYMLVEFVREDFVKAKEQLGNIKKSV
jgi:GNAT superfamily N-acetyltransferase